MKALAVVIPVYNEEALIEQTLTFWLQELSSLTLDFQIILINDGSNDATPLRLKKFEGHERIQIIHQDNQGHGPSILKGYQQAVRQAEWVFQCDGDSEVPVKEFQKLWPIRKDFDFVIGYRQNRRAPLVRQLLTAVAGFMINIFYRANFKDVNAPFRLMKSQALSNILKGLPLDLFTPNIILCGKFKQYQYRIKQVPVNYQPRKAGASVLNSWKIVVFAIKAFFQVFGTFPYKRQPHEI